MPPTDDELSKTLSYVLRHRPDLFGLELSDAGWVSLEALVTALGQAGHGVTRDDIVRVVQSNDKQRFSISEGGRDIRANQGHTKRVDLGYQKVVPPGSLFHGTVRRFIASIRADGLQKKQRHHVHLSPNVEIATAVGARRGKPVVLEIKAGQMHDDGHDFFLSSNGVWLTDHVPAAYICFPAD